MTERGSSTSRDSASDIVAALLSELEPDLQVVRLIGRGSMASVFLARERALKRLVAVKLLAPLFADDLTARARFEREAQSAARIEHPNVVPIYRVGTLSEGLPYLVMRYVEGRSAADRLQAEGRLDPADAQDILAQVASALAAAHERNIVHRDVKPANVLLERGTKRALLTDFGIAAITASGESAASRLTPFGQLVGDPRYMSPEQLEGAELTERADVYGLGILGYELLTEEGPYGSLVGPPLIKAHVQSDPRPIAEVRDDVAADLEALLRRCLAKDPAHRPDAADVAGRLSHGTAAPVAIEAGAAGAAAGPIATQEAGTRTSTAFPEARIGEGKLDLRPGPDAIRLKVLKGVDLRAADGRQLLSIVSQPQKVGVLTYLAMSAVGGFKRRDELLGVFWPDVDQESARHALRQALYVLRRALGPKVILARGAEELGISSDRLWCDAVAFEQALDAGRTEEALELYAGDLLPGFFIDGAPQFESWLDGQRERLRRRASDAVWGLAADSEAAGDLSAAADWARKAAEFTAFDEGALCRLIELLDRLGDRAGAIRAYELFASRLKAEFEADPAPETQALIGKVRDRK